MKGMSLQGKARRVTRFVWVQFIALLGWILVQLFFSLSPLGHSLPLALTLCIEAIWWMGLLLIMLLLFLQEYNRFVQAALDLEEANQRLRRATNQIVESLRTQDGQKPAQDGQKPEPEEPEVREKQASDEK